MSPERAYQELLERCRAAVCGPEAPTHAVIAERIGRSRRTVLRILGAKTSNPAALTAIASVLGVSCDRPEPGGPVASVPEAAQVLRVPASRVWAAREREGAGRDWWRNREALYTWWEGLTNRGSEHA